MSDTLRLSDEEVELVVNAIEKEIVRLYDVIAEQTPYDPDDVLDGQSMVDMEAAQTSLCYHTLERMHDRVEADHELPLEQAWGQYLPQILQRHADDLNAHHGVHDDRDLQATQLSDVANSYRQQLTADSEPGAVSDLTPTSGPKTNAVNLIEADEDVEEAPDE